jgi:ssRNA-specific RNase YbeY (16S rRNA maturation enzyme)
MSRMSAQELAGHWLHEYMHMLGFDHAYGDNPARKFSVPYFVGDLAVQRAYALDAHVLNDRA